SFPKLREDFAAVLARLEKAPVSFSLPNSATGQLQSIKLSSTMFREHLRGLLYSPETTNSLPLVIHYATEGEFRPFGGLVLEYMRALRASGLQIALGMHLGVICSEHVPFITQAEMSRETDGTFYGAERVRVQIKACESWPSSKVNARFIEPVKSD